MRRLLVLAVLAALVSFAAPAHAGVGGDTGELTIVHAATYDAEAPFPVTLCIDETVVDDDLVVGDILGPDTTPAGSYDVEIFGGAGVPDCTGDPAIAGTVEVEAGDDLTAMAYWGPEGLDLAVLDNDNSCTEPGEGRLTARHAADAGPVNVVADASSGSPVEVLADVEPGGQATTDLPADTYSDVEVQLASDDSPILGLGDVEIVDGEQLVVYVIGGNDGDVGAFTDTIAEETCEEPTTTTTTVPAAPLTPATPATPAPVATPVTAAATFTG